MVIINQLWPSFLGVLKLFILSFSIGFILGHSSSQSLDHKCSYRSPNGSDILRAWPVSSKCNSCNNEEIDFVPIARESPKTKNAGTNESVSSRIFKRDLRQLMEFSYSGTSELLPNSLGSRRKEPMYHHGSSSDYVPMKISIYYDDSVQQLEEQKSSLIKKNIMPTVIKFFESALSIRRDFTIETFRISRRCANVTYAKDNYGTPKLFCLNRCDDYSVCGEILVPSSHLAGCSYCNTTSRKCYTNHSAEGKGVSDAQLLIYVSAKQTQRCGREQTIAYAAHCAQDSKTDRPVAGHANLCPNSISTDPKDVSSLIATVKHELTHVLGLSVSLFAYYRDQSGRPLTDRSNWNAITTGNSPPKDPSTGYPLWSDKIIKKVVRKGWVSGEGPVDKEVFLLVTPTVVREVRAHFNCNSLEGAELEDQGYDGTSMTHWEKRLFENEAMTGTHTHNSIYSRLTLAALQDTGWYVANFSMAEKLHWGKNLGCEFATQSCKYWMDKQRSQNNSLDPFCDRIKSDSLQITCSSDHTAKAVCNMRKHKQPLSGFYRHFDQLDGIGQNEVGYYGGTVDLADYCPFLQEYTVQHHPITIRGSRCSHPGNNLEIEKNLALESFSPQSMCFIHGRRWTNESCNFNLRGWVNHGAGCYKTLCSNGYITVYINETPYYCFYKDQVIDIIQKVKNTLFNGSIVCPNCDMICPHMQCKQFHKLIIEDIVKKFDININDGNTVTSQTKLTGKNTTKDILYRDNSTTAIDRETTSFDSKSRWIHLLDAKTTKSRYTQEELILLRKWIEIASINSNLEVNSTGRGVVSEDDLNEYLKIYHLYLNRSYAMKLLTDIRTTSHNMCSSADTEGDYPKFKLLQLSVQIAFSVSVLIVLEIFYNNQVSL